MNTKFEIQKAPRAFRTISEVAGELNLEPYVIRFWESQFKQIRPMRRKGGRRYYRPADIDFLKGLKALLHGENLTIKKVKETIIKKGKKFIVGWPNEKIAEPSSRIEKRKLQRFHAWAIDTRRPWYEKLKTIHKKDFDRVCRHNTPQD